MPFLRLNASLTVRRTALLERCLRRLEYEKAREAEAQAAADQAEAERLAMQAIDWCEAQRCCSLERTAWPKA